MGEESDDDGGPDHRPGVVTDFDAVEGRSLSVHASEERKGSEDPLDLGSDADDGNESSADAEDGELCGPTVRVLALYRYW